MAVALFGSTRKDERGDRPSAGTLTAGKCKISAAGIGFRDDEEETVPCIHVGAAVRTPSSNCCSATTIGLADVAARSLITRVAAARAAS